MPVTPETALLEAMLVGGSLAISRGWSLVHGAALEEKSRRHAHLGQPVTVLAAALGSRAQLGSAGKSLVRYIWKI